MLTFWFSFPFKLILISKKKKNYKITASEPHYQQLCIPENDIYYSACRSIRIEISKGRQAKWCDGNGGPCYLLEHRWSSKRHSCHWEGSSAFVHNLSSGALCSLLRSVRIECFPGMIYPPRNAAVYLTLKMWDRKKSSICPPKTWKIKTKRRWRFFFDAVGRNNTIAIDINMLTIC